ncbi:hypothetical protein ACO22_05293 [Paracoccidioides brasiliensis]|uniref:DUF7924 domain-containing protein n=1 Tax=Paracoccidioides brasiliensis TaxID=121759 RepID=A0A1D2JAU3_PARBR|nr:hypothetical protein ACO22_05293 [Paracoccidioides brasiliensis]
MSQLLARKKWTSSLCRRQTESTLTSSTTPSDQKPREEKSAQYKNPRYEIVLETKGSYMSESKKGITELSESCYLTLLNAAQKIPEDLLFCDDLFKSTCEKVRRRNEAIVIQDITRLIVPSAENLAIYVGFKRDAFTDGQLLRLRDFVVTCGAASLDIADRQNAHSATIAVRATVELFKLVKREREVDREILTFSISHDHTAVRICGHYAVLDGEKTNFYRHPIHQVRFHCSGWQREMDGIQVHKECS